jgi:4-alpha-glucanotransferase
MWAIFQLQDYLGVDETIRRTDPNEERINIPANPKHYWRYRMHINLEDLILSTSFNQGWKEAIQSSGR